MKLLSPTKAKDAKKIETEQLLDMNVRLRKQLGERQAELREVQDDYSPDKARALKEFKEFLRDLSQKRSKALEELRDIDRLITQRKEIYYGLIAKQDAIEERNYQNDERERKLDLRERFVQELEKKQHG